ncbi:MAG: Na/Pi symporter, partial [Candidatus Marinimicrobia bacterium]|nr:Na/Pi symporter [Candidatus Neomarinimicrobiota bacterium]
LIIGIVATSIIQSSSVTTSLVVGLVAGGALTLETSIPIIMGANIGTTITNTLVSFGHISNLTEFKRAFGASIVHDFFNILAVIILFPLEMFFHPLKKSAMLLETIFSDIGGYKAFDPLKFILEPVIKFVDEIFSFLPFSNILLVIFAFVLLFFSLTQLVNSIRSSLITRLEVIVNQYLFKNAFIGFVFGMIITAIVQSSSVTTSLIIPLAGAGIVTIAQIFPYTLGANIGTTVTAILAAMATQNPIAITVAFSHLCFNIFGILIIYPFKFIPIKLAEFVGNTAGNSKRNLAIYITIYILLHFIPVLFIFLT